MNRSLPSRLLLGLLAVLLQVALLPAQRHVPCMVRTGELGGCCCIVAESAPKPDCCDVGQPGSEGDVDALPRLEGRCTCGLDVGEFPAIPEITGAKATVETEGESDDSAPLAARFLVEQRLDRAARPVALRATPPARTGPPRHVLLQVFLI